MPQDNELTPALEAMKQEILGAIADVKRDVERIDATTLSAIADVGNDVTAAGNSVAVLRSDLAALTQKVDRIDATTRDMAPKVQYLYDNVLGSADHAELKRAGGGVR